MKITDNILLEHAAEARDIWLSTLPSDEDITEFVTSKRFEKKMKKLIRKQARTPKTNRILRFMKQSAAVVLIVALLSFGGLMTVEAYREKVIEIVVHVFQELTDYRFSSEKTGINEIVLPEVNFEQIPEGMHEVQNRTTNNNRRFIVYENKEGLFFELTQRPIRSDGEYISILDTEDSTYRSIAINGYEAYSNEKDGNGSIVWLVNNIVYRLYGNMEIDELKAIAESIRILSK